MVQRRTLNNGITLSRFPNPNGFYGHTYFIETPNDANDCGYPSVLVWDSNAVPPDVMAASLAWELDKTDASTNKKLTKDFNMR